MDFLAKENQEAGHVYVIQNKWIGGLVKIGATRSIEDRFDSLHANLPGESALVWHRKVDDCFGVENEVRNSLSDFRVNSSKDWFQVPAKIAIDQFESIISAGKAAGVMEKLAAPENIEANNAKDLGSYCRKWRNKSGLTQAGLAEMCGVGVRFISEFENGKQTCEIQKCLHVLSVLGIDLFAVKRQF